MARRRDRARARDRRPSTITSPRPGSRLDEALWSRQRTREVGLSDDPKLRSSMAVLNYSIRALYGELSNIAQLRDEISLGTLEDPIRRVRRPKGQLRQRVKEST